MMLFEVAVQAHNFDKRLCWMLSSIIDQTEGGVGVRVACLKDSPTEGVARYFRFNRLDVHTMPYDSLERLQPRGHVRTDQLRACRARWIIFADGDMLYPPDFFARARELVEGPFKDSAKCLYSSRSSTGLASTDSMVDALKYPCYVHGAFQRASKLVDHKCRNIGAGYFQMVNVERMMTLHGGYYQSPEVSRDGKWIDGPNRVRSDRKFRTRVGCEAVPLPDQLHLQHDRNYLTGGSK